MKIESAGGRKKKDLHLKEDGVLLLCEMRGWQAISGFGWKEGIYPPCICQAVFIYLAKNDLSPHHTHARTPR